MARIITRKPLSKQSRQGWGVVRNLARPALIVGIYTAVFICFHRYDWGHPLVKAACYATLFLLVLFSARTSTEHSLTHTHVTWELAITAVVLVSVCVILGFRYLPYLATPARCDIGYTTHDAAQLAVFGHQDPYQSTTLNKVGRDPKFWGYHYGPAMFFFYLPTAWFSSAALKVLTVFYLVLLAGVTALLLRERAVPGQRRWLASVLFALLLISIPERQWYEIAVQGSTDVLPVLLILLSLYAVDRKRFMVAGICAGLSFAAKFSPALFFIALFIRRELPLRFFGGLAVATLPLMVYLVWSGMPMLNNMFLFHATKTFDSTSLYSVTPAGMHFVFPLIQAAALLYFVLSNFTREIEVKDLAVNYTLLLIVIEMTYQEVHANHIIWFIPMAALILSWHRDGEFRLHAS